jgi:hypothetical protein
MDGSDSDRLRNRIVSRTVAGSQDGIHADRLNRAMCVFVISTFAALSVKSS